MKFEETDFEGLKILHAFNPKDNRGQFVKYFNDDLFRRNQMEFEIKEVYYSVSFKKVIRGMHFQLPPKAHDKIVFVSHGEISDVCLDLRKKSETFGKIFNQTLSSENNKGIFIPKGFAHGFETISDVAVVHYLQSTAYSKEHDFGVLWNSFGHVWRESNPIISSRDEKFITMNEYINSKNNCF